MAIKKPKMYDHSFVLTKNIPTKMLKSAVIRAINSAVLDTVKRIAANIRFRMPLTRKRKAAIFICVDIGLFILRWFI